MGVGVGSIVDVVGHVIHGPAKVFDHVISEKDEDGKPKFTVIFHTDTIKTAWRGTGEMTYPAMLKDRKLVKKMKIEERKLKALGSWDEALHSDTHMIVPINRERHVIFKNGQVYDRIAKKKLHRSGLDMVTVGYAKISPSVELRLKWIMSSPSTPIRLFAVSMLGLLVDLLACYKAYRKGEKKGEKRGYKRALLGQVPVGSGSNSGLFSPSLLSGSHLSGSGGLLAQFLSPFPLPLQPLSNKPQFGYPNPQLSAQIQEAAERNRVQGQAPPQAYQATQQSVIQQQLMA